MKPTLPLGLFSTAVATLIAFSSPAAQAQAIIVAPMAPPPPRVEVMPAPRPGYVWDNGRWRWDHGRYVWVTGHWQPVPLDTGPLGPARSQLPLGRRALALNRGKASA
jgi:WXXGXW repeat (2 copies)